MSGFEFSPDAQEAMRGDFVLAGESALATATVRDFDLPEEPINQLSLSDDLIEAAKDYLDPAKPLSLEAQLQFNSLIMGAMGLHPPHGNLTTTQSNKLEQSYNAFASQPNISVGYALTRLVVAPLFASNSNLLENRQNMLCNVQDNVPGTGLSTDQEPLWTPSNEWAYGQLLQNPNSISDKDGAHSVKSGLRYMSPLYDGIIDRQTYLQQLLEGGFVVPEPGLHDTLWTYNFVDVHPITPRSWGRNVQALFESLGSVSKTTSTPEQELAIQAVHLVTGQQNTDYHVNFTNEAVYELTERDQPEVLYEAAGMNWNTHNRQLELAGWLPNDHDGDLGLRASVSGL